MTGKNQRQKSSGRKGYPDAARRKRVKDAGGNKALQGLSLDALLKAGEKDISDEELAKIAARENNALAKKFLKNQVRTLNAGEKRRQKVSGQDKGQNKHSP